MLKVNCHKEFLALSNFNVILLIMLVLVVTDYKSISDIQFVDLLIFGLYITSCFSVKFTFKQLKSRNEKHFNNSAFISNTALNIKGLEVWFMTMAPAFVLSLNTKIEKWLMLFIILTLLRVISAQKIFVYNILFCIVGYNFWGITIDGNEYICITSLNKSQLLHWINNYNKYSIIGEEVIYIKKQ